MSVVSTSAGYPQEAKMPLTMFAVGAGVLLAVLGVIEWHAAPIRADNARSLSMELAAESRAFCEKHGMATDAQGHKGCISDLQIIRDKQSERVNRDMGFGY
jgi:hypothetical protein